MSWAEQAGRLGGMAGAVLGWPPDRFWTATPAELAGVVAALSDAGAGDTAVPPDAGMIARMQEAFPDG